MTLQVLKYFVSVAYHRSYTKAAKECYITQPALSRAIFGLEQELGCQLLERNTKRVTLTPAGAICLQDAQEILAKCEQLKIHVCGGNQTQYHLKIGYTYIGYLSLLTRKLTGYHEMFQFDTEYAPFERLRQKVLKRELDIILVPKVNCEGALGLEYTVLDKSRLCIMLHHKHALAHLDEVTVEDLKRERFVAWDEEQVPGANRAHCSFCQEFGFLPNYVAVGKMLGDVLMQAQRHDAVAMISKNIDEALPSEFKVIPIQESTEQFGLVCAWREGSRAQSILKLKTILMQAETPQMDLLLEGINENNNDKL